MPGARLRPSFSSLKTKIHAYSQTMKTSSAKP
jgi:hypothetical protein